MIFFLIYSSLLLNLLYKIALLNSILSACNTFNISLTILIKNCIKLKCIKMFLINLYLLFFKMIINFS